MLAPAVVIDVSAKAEADPDYRLTKDDVVAWETQHGPVPAESIVLMQTGWSKRWPDRMAYFGDDTLGDASNLHFPSYGEDSARYLVEERKVGVLGWIRRPSITGRPRISSCIRWPTAPMFRGWKM